MKKTIAVFIIAFSLALTAGLAACGGNSNSGKFQNFDTAEEVYAFSAASAGMIISAMDENASALAADKYSVTENDGAAANYVYSKETDRTATTVSENFNELDKYMILVESLLSDQNFGIKISPSDREGYREKSVVSYKDLNGNPVSYEMFYNKIPVRTEIDGSETEETYSISGVMIIDGTEYSISGERRDENEHGESESETEFTVTLSESAFIKVEQNMEQEDDETEQEYSYSIFENGKLTERSAFSYETERRETELKMVSINGGEKHTLYFEKEKRGNDEFIRIRISDNGITESYRVERIVGTDGEISYSYTPISNDFDD